MKRRQLLGASIMLAILLSVAGLAGAQVTAPSGIGPEAKTWDIIYDGYCDGLNVTFDTATGLAVGSNAASCRTCYGDDLVAGTAGFINSQGSGLSLTYQTYGGSSPMWFYAVVRRDHTWTLYDFSGAVLNSGTWSHCPSKAPDGAVPAGTR
jgi:hypothetical protein